ncbi:hypothetical protein JOB18_025423 [Solea senegalensis]|uniref:Uncharacterized protein n=1 Tax=Solea senegalensis TaxID=28829 RepID=A0AAV6SE51_SOLSE|nr:hypothetical protein JOB18_025423 [Solea senegalensis]
MFCLLQTHNQRYSVAQLQRIDPQPRWSRDSGLSPSLRFEIDGLVYRCGGKLHLLSLVPQLSNNTQPTQIIRCDLPLDKYSRTEFKASDTRESDEMMQRRIRSNLKNEKVK